MTGQILYAARDGIATLTMSQPERLNAVSLDMWQALPVLVQRALDDRQIRAIVLTGAGEQAFCAGADISKFSIERSAKASALIYDAAVEAAESALANAEKPTLALIKGVCYGGGLGLAMTCDLRLASADAKFRLPAARLGIGYSMQGVARLAHRLGQANATEILFTANTYDAMAAKALGIVQQVFATPSFNAKVQSWLTSLAQNAPLSLKAAKLALAAFENAATPATTPAVTQAIIDCYESDDYREGRQAFTQKRQPKFSGK